MWSKPHGQTCPFNLGAGRDWVNTRPEQFSQAPGRMILFGGQGLCLELVGSPQTGEQFGGAVCSLLLQEAQADLKAAYMSQNQTLQSLLQLPFPSPQSLFQGYSWGWAAHISPGECHPLLPSLGSVTALLGEPGTIVLSQTSCEPVCASAPLFDLAYLALECQLLQKFKKCLLL